MTIADNEKRTRLREIKQLVGDFCNEYLNEKFEIYCYTLWDILGRKRKIDVTRGKSEQWAASIVYVIAQLNFMFDPKHEFYISGDDICNFFGTPKSTTGNKANQIREMCKITNGMKGLCTPDVVDMFTFYVTSGGVVISKSMLQEMVRDRARKQEIEQGPSLSFEEKWQQEIERQRTERQEKLEKRKNKNQMGMFDGE